MEEEGAQEDGPTPHTITQVTQKGRGEELHPSLHPRAQTQVSSRAGEIVVEVIEEEFRKD